MSGASYLSSGAASRFGIGTAALTIPYGAPGAQRLAPTPAQARRTLLAAVDRGVRLIDTAPAYGESETLIGATLAGREECMFATKLAVPGQGWETMSSQATRAHVRASVAASLKALRRERLDLLQIHNADAGLVRGGVLRELLLELREEGLAVQIGATVYGEDAALAVIEEGFDVVQVAFSALDRRVERRVLPAATASKTAVVARSLLLRGVLSGAGRTLSGHFAPLAAAADTVRLTLGASWEQLPGAAVAFAANHPGIACVLLGPREESELTALLDQAERFGERTKGLQLPATELPDWLLDPSRWPAEGDLVHRV